MIWITRGVLYILAGWAVLFFAFTLLHIIKSFPDNHWGYDVLIGNVPAFLALVCQLGLWRVTGPRTRWVFLIGLVCLIIMFFIIDAANIKVNYDKWLQRGMPKMF